MEAAANCTTYARLLRLEARAVQALERYQELSAGADAAWTIGCAVLVFSMQIGFTLVEAGAVKCNLRSILMKNVVATALCAFMWWFISHVLMRGSYFNSFARVDVPYSIVTSYISWFWDLSFVCAASTIVSGAMAERVKFLGYCAYVLWISGFIYPFVAHWEWTPNGFLSVYNTEASLPMLDFAGCGAVHLVGGTASLVGAWIIGPRPGGFMDEMAVFSKKEYRVQDRFAATLSLYSVIGVMILWVGWYGFNCGSSGGVVGKSDQVGLVAVNTTLGAMAGALFASTVSYFQYRLFKVDMVLMGILSGLVSITGAAAYVRCHMVVPIAVIGFLVYHTLVWVLSKLGIDDPVAAFPIHGGCGFWGLLASGFFQDSALSGATSWGAQLRNQFAGAFIILGWTLAMSLTFLVLLNFLLRGLRSVDSEAEFRRDAGLQNASGPRGVVTILCTDIQSSTVLWEADEESMQEALALHDNVFRTALQEYNGFEVKTEGDAFVCAFGTVADCAKFCGAVQHRLMEVKWPKGLYANNAARIEDDDAGIIIWKGLRVRMGFHTGEPSAQENPLTQRTDYFGKDVNYAARISGVGAGGQIVLSSASVRELLPLCQSRGKQFAATEPFAMQVGERYAAPALECFVEYMGRRRLKEIMSLHEDGEHVYQLRPFGLEARNFGDVVPEPRQSLLGSCHPSRFSSAQQSPKSIYSGISAVFSSPHPQGRRPRDRDSAGPARSAVLPAPANPPPAQAWVPDDVLSNDPATPLIISPSAPALLHARTFALYVTQPSPVAPAR